VTALVGNVVWACIAGIGIALVVAGVVAGIVRVQRPAAATRCLLWFIALAVCALAPLAIVGTMAVRGIGQPTAAASTPSIDDAGAASTVPATHPTLHALAGATRSLRRPPSLTRRVALAIVAIWALGALAGLVGLARSLSRVQALKARSSPLEGALADDLPWLTEIAGREIYLRLSYEIETPIAVGFRRPVILIPTDMATADGLAAIESIVMHEYAHLARYDDWTNLAQRFIERIVWFNPLVWFLGRRIALEREVAADDAVVARTNDAKHYASTLWRMAREMRMPEHVVVAPGAMLTRKQISIRIERLLEDSRAHRPQAGSAFVAIALCACTVAAVAATAPPIVFASAGDPAAVAVLAPVAGDEPTPAPAPTAEPLPPDFGQRIASAVKRVVVFAPHMFSCAGCNLENADLHGKDLHGVRLDGANLDGVDLHGSNLRGASLVGANLNDSNLDHADLRDANLTGANLSGASMNGTQTGNAVMTGATLP
jgi:beta-lactamase regulating signal transducer with metallopeptidase domain